MRARGSAAGSGGAIYATTPQVVDLFAGATGNTDGTGFSNITVDAVATNNAYLINQGNAVNDFFTRQVTVGPEGSIWALRYGYVQAPDGGKFKFQIGSVPEPDPQRAGVSDTGTLLRSDDITYFNLGGEQDGYAAVKTNVDFSGQHVFRFMGADHAELTNANIGTDAWTGYTEVNGGSGVYRIKCIVTGKNAASTGFRVRLTGMAWVRLDDNGFM